MHRQAAPHGRLPSRAAARITLGVLAALDECHTKGVVHGSPHQNNVALRSGVEPALIATPTRDAAEAGQLRYTMLTGHTPESSDRSMQLRIPEGCASDLMSALGIDSGLAEVAVALRALKCEPSSRYQSAGAMRLALNDWLNTPS